MADDLGSNWWELDEEDEENNDVSYSSPVNDFGEEIDSSAPGKVIDDGTISSCNEKISSTTSKAGKLRSKENDAALKQTKKKAARKEFQDPVGKQKRKRHAHASTDANGKKTSEEIKTDDAKKDKRRRKGISREKLPISGITPDLFKAAVFAYFNQLSQLEIDQMSLEVCHFTSCNEDNNHTITSYLREIIPKWHRISQNFNHKTSPLIIVVCSNALRACQLNKDAQLFKGKECKSIKLFSRHIKIDKQAEALKKTLFHFAVGTPERLKALLEQGY